MNIFLLICCIFIAGCGDQKLSHIADLPKSEISSDEIQLFKEDKEFRSTEPAHNIVPPHGIISVNRINWLVSENCTSTDAVTICYENYFLNTGLKIFIRELSDGDSRLELNFKPEVNRLLSRFIGAAPARLHTVIKFSNRRVGLLHSFGFTLFRGNNFCSTILTNPNHKIAFGESKDLSKVLIYSSDPSTKVDRPVDGWRVYEEGKLCP